MQNRLALCAKHLREVEAKLIELRNDRLEEDAQISEALSFLQQAIDAVTRTHEKLKNVPASRTKMPKIPSA